MPKIQYKFIAGDLCLDFCNTVHNFGHEGQHDDLSDYPELMSWCQQAGILASGEAASLVREAKNSPAASVTVLKRAKAQRDLMRRIFSDIVSAGEPREEDVKGLNEELKQVMRWARVVPADGGFTWGWLKQQDALDRALWPLVKSAADLLTSDRLSRVRECAFGECTWLFVDTSRNNRRRWCDMRDCGNRAKFRRYYEQRRLKGLSADV